jgi:two-component system OmpR family response regulator
MKILLLEDELMLQNSINEYLEGFGFKCELFTNGSKALESIENNEYDLLLLDINVPGISGIELVSKLNKLQIFTPTIFISANLDIDTISEAFDLGAIDYLKKPFHLKELGIRLQKEIDRIASTKSNHITLSKNYTLSLDDDRLYFNKNVVELTKKKKQIIKYLAKNMGMVITIDTLREYIWDSEPVSDATIRTEMSRLKKLLEEDFIRNIKGVGYIIDKYVPKVS